MSVVQIHPLRLVMLAANILDKTFNLKTIRHHVKNVALTAIFQNIFRKWFTVSWITSKQFYSDAYSNQILLADKKIASWKVREL